MYRKYLIMQEAGRAARARRSPNSYLRPRRVAVVEASGEVEALKDFEFDKYLTTGNRQFVNSRLQWASARSMDRRWRDWDGTSDPGTRGRTWRLVVTLRNGNVEHEAVFYAWRDR